MKKLSYALLATAALGIVSCAGNQNGYTVNGNIKEGATDGDTILIQKEQGRSLVPVDTILVKNNKFSFTGTQDTATMRYLTFTKKDGNAITAKFVLENGQINIDITDKAKVSGTVSNDALQSFNEQMEALNQKAEPLAKIIYNPETDEETRNSKMAEFEALENEYRTTIDNAVINNITNLTGISLYKSAYYNYSTEKNDSILKLIPEMYQTDEGIAFIKKTVEKQKATAPGQKFIDFEMKTPEGEAIKLSDYIGKGKVVLIDFWASWCGPCRHEMPNIVAAYKQYKDKNFEIVGVSLDRDLEAWKKAIKDDGITWPQMSDLKFWQSEGAQLYAVNSIPHTVLVDGEGTILARGLHGEELQTKLAEVLK